MKAFKAFIKPFESSQRSEKAKIYFKFFPLSEIGMGRINNYIRAFLCLGLSSSHHKMASESQKSIANAQRKLKTILNYKKDEKVVSDKRKEKISWQV